MKFGKTSNFQTNRMKNLYPKEIQNKRIVKNKYNRMKSLKRIPQKKMILKIKIIQKIDMKMKNMPKKMKGKKEKIKINKNTTRRKKKAIVRKKNIHRTKGKKIPEIAKKVKILKILKFLKIIKNLKNQEFHNMTKKNQVKRKS